MRLLFWPFIIGLMIFGCSKATEQGVSPDGKAASQLSSVITHAEITTVNPTVEKALIAQYSSNNSEGNKITVRFRWYVDGILVPSVEGNVLEPEFYSKGARVEAEAVPVVNGVEAKPFKLQAVSIQNTAPVITAIELSPSPAFPGDKITATVQGSDPDKKDELTYLYEWEVNSAKVEGATAQVLDTAGLKKKSIISVTVTPFDGQDRGMPKKSNTAIVLSNRNPEITSSPSIVLENGIYVYQVTARDPDGDPITFTLENGPLGMTIDHSSGLIRWQPPKQVLEKQDVTIKVSVEDGDGGKTFQEFSFTIGVK